MLSWHEHCLHPAGLLGFPPKELQYRFLSQFTPVFYIRQRDYSKVHLLTEHLLRRSMSYIILSKGDA